MSGIVILGTGLAGYTVARELRRAGYTGELTLISRDDGGFYSKPMLSNALAAGKDADALLITPAAEMATTLKADVLNNTAVLAIDTAQKILHTSAGDLPYAQLVLAIGADPIRLPLAGSAAAEVCSINDRAGYARFRSLLAAGAAPQRVALLGGGLIGCEFANDLASAGHQVAVIDPSPAALGRLVPEAIGRAMQAALEANGVRWFMQTTAKSIDANADGSFSIALANGEKLAADIILSAVGLAPRTEIAAAAGLAIGRAIEVDTKLETSTSGIYALGDCAEVEGVWRPFVLPITHAAKALAKTLTGIPTTVAFPAMPVVVKTPALPTVVCPPAAGAEGAWSVSGESPDLEARFVGTAGQLLGFALTGEAATRKQSLLRELAA